LSATTGTTLDGGIAALAARDLPLAVSIVRARRTVHTARPRSLESVRGRCRIVTCVLRDPAVAAPAHASTESSRATRAWPSSFRRGVL
jgi:hypothetical protein